MSAPLVKTATPGIYKRGGRYVVTFRDLSGKQRKKAARTLAEARALKGSSRPTSGAGSTASSRR